MSHPTLEQLAAVEAFRKRHGRRWKATLRFAWDTGMYASSDSAPLLQQLRNEFGPLWLNAYRPGDTKAGVLIAQPALPFPGQARRGLPRTVWAVTAGNGQDLHEPFDKKEDARCYCQNNGITLIEEPK